MVETARSTDATKFYKEKIGNGMPDHIAIIPDGNRRWATGVGLPIATGYDEGAQRIAEVADEARILGVKNATFWIVSPDNIAKRNPLELGLWYDSLRLHLVSTAIPELTQKGVRIKNIGRLNTDRLPEDIVEDLSRFEEQSQSNLGMTLTLAMNYSGDEDVNDAFSYARLKGESITSIGDLKQNLYTARLGLPDPDWVIRTGNDKRLSNFMPLQVAKSDYDFPNVKWPDFTRHKLRASVKRFAAVKKTHGA